MFSETCKLHLRYYHRQVSDLGSVIYLPHISRQLSPGLQPLLFFALRIVSFLCRNSVCQYPVLASLKVVRNLKQMVVTR